MKELKCPKCGTAITIDEADYAAILNQVRGAEFDLELKRREGEIKATLKAQSELELRNRLAQQSAEITKRETEITKLREQMESIATAKELDKKRATAELEATIATLKASLANVDNTVQIAVMKEQALVREQLQTKDMEIERLRSAVNIEKNEAAIRENSLRQRHEEQMQAKQREVEFYRDFKSRMSTKMIGESLEEHCATEFERSLRPHMPKAQFGKDNTVVDHTKGDFIGFFGEIGSEGRAVFELHYFGNAVSGESFLIFRAGFTKIRFLQIA
jgi:hypothetical protein